MSDVNKLKSQVIKGERLKIKTGKLVLKNDEHVSKTLGRKFIAFLMTAVLLLAFFILSKVLTISAEKLEIICKWTVISGTAYTGGNATIASISQIATTLKNRK